MEKWGLYSCSSFPFLLLMCRFFAGRASLSHISERRKEGRREEKNAAEEGEMVQNSGEQRRRASQKVIFFFEGLSGRVRVREKKGQEERGRMRRCQICLSP